MPKSLADLPGIADSRGERMDKPDYSNLRRVRSMRAEPTDLRNADWVRERNNSRFLDSPESPMNGRSASLEMTKLEVNRRFLSASACE